MSDRRAIRNITINMKYERYLSVSENRAEMRQKEGSGNILVNHYNMV